MNNIKRIFQLIFLGKWTFNADGVSFTRQNLIFFARLNILVQIINRKLRLSFVLGVPYCLAVEPASICNLKCAICPAGINKKMCSPALLKIEDFKKTIDLFGDYITYIQLWSWGEPFLNPDLPEMIAYAKTKGIIVVTSTNGHYLLDKEWVSRLVHSGLDELILAVDGTTQEVYETYREGGDLQKVLTGIKNAVEIRNQEGTQGPRLHMRMVINPYNEKQMEEFIDLARGLGVDLTSFKKIDTGMGGIAGNNELLPQNQEYVIRYSNAGYRYKCANFWNFPVLSSSGRLGLCSLDSERETELEHTNDIKSIHKSWNSRKAKDCRKAIKRDANTFQFCRECACREPDFKNAYFNVTPFKGREKNECNA